MGLQPKVIFHRHHILTALNAEFLQPFRAHILPARALGHRLAVRFLTFFAEEPVHENFRRVRMGRIFHHRYDAAAVVDVRAFFDFRNGFYRQASFDEGIVTVMTETDRKR